MESKAQLGPGTSLLYVMLEDEQGFLHSFMVSHFHHEASLRKKQWSDIAMLPRSLIAPNTIWLCDHNSVLLPTRDVANSKAATEQPATIDAREEEASTLMRFGLVDAYACAHSGRATDHDPHGWTWGFPSSKAKSYTNTPQQNSKRQKKQTSDDDDQAHSCDRRRGINRIHIPCSMESFISECYPTLLADSDHKLVLLGLQCPSAPAATRRKRYPVGFLSDEEEVSEIKSQLQTIPGEGEIWWGKALSLIPRKAVQYETKHTLTGFTELQVLVMESTRLRLCPQAWHYLRTNGYPSIRDPAPAYSLLVHMAESQQRDRSCAMVLDKLKTLMNEPFDAPVRRTRQEVWRLVKQLQ